MLHRPVEAPPNADIRFPVTGRLSMLVDWDRAAGGLDISYKLYYICSFRDGVGKLLFDL